MWGMGQTHNNDCLEVFYIVRLIIFIGQTSSHILSILGL